MTKDQIVKIIENSKFTKVEDKFSPLEFSNIFCLFNDKEAYGIHIIKRKGVSSIIVTKITPDLNSTELSIDDISNVESMKAMWADEVIKEYGNIINAMESFS